MSKHPDRDVTKQTKKKEKPSMISNTGIFLLQMFVLILGAWMSHPLGKRSWPAFKELIHGVVWISLLGAFQVKVPPSSMPLDDRPFLFLLGIALAGSVTGAIVGTITAFPLRWLAQKILRRHHMISY
jgi:hypothetical protein